MSVDRDDVSVFPECRGFGGDRDDVSVFSECRGFGVDCSTPLAILGCIGLFLERVVTRSECQGLADDRDVSLDPGLLSCMRAMSND